MKKKVKIYILLILMFLLACVLNFSHAYSSLSNFAPKYGVLTENTNFRSKATTKEAAIKILKKGTGVKMLGKIDNFYIVQLGTNEVGAVYSSYVKSYTSSPQGAKTYTMITKKNGTINGSNVNFRRGPGTTFQSITQLAKGTNVTVIGYIGDWYLCVLSNSTIGMVSKSLVSFNTQVAPTPTPTPTTTTTITKGDSNEELILQLINNARIKAGLKALTMDSGLLNIARLKSQDMVNKEYFSHSSPTYGSPFEMMKKYSISYKVAGENIAGNPSLENAVTSWLNSNTHRQNILSTSYNLVGIGVTKSNVYGYIIVAMFVGR